MKDDENRIRPTKKGMAAPVTEASLRLEVTDLLLSSSSNSRMGRFSGGLIPEQRAVLERIEAELEAYGSFFYRPDHWR